MFSIDFWILKKNCNLFMYIFLHTCINLVFYALFLKISLFLSQATLPIFDSIPISGLPHPSEVNYANIGGTLLNFFQSCYSTDSDKYIHRHTSKGFIWSLFYENGMKMHTQFSACGSFQHQWLIEILQSQLVNCSPFF